jgi:large subunit ribosomal protein LX
MGDIKTFKIVCSYKVGVFRIRLTKEIRALKLEEALEKLYSDVGSHHKVKRRNLKIEEVEVYGDG